jgi:type I restriction enzyme S subunit
MNKHVNKIEKLLADLCPKGVEFKELEEVVKILDSQRKSVSKSQRTAGAYPYYGANGIQDYVDDYIFDGTFVLLGEDGSVINKDGSPVLNWATGKIWVNNHAHVLAEKAEVALLRYVYFALSIIDVTKVVKGIIPNITQQNLRNFRIPIPPLAIQQEIVKILDNFTTELKAELEAELEARKKQYEYYRNKLLTFDRQT